MSKPIYVKCEHKSDRKDKVYLGILKYSTYHYDKRRSEIRTWSGDTWKEGVPDYIKLVKVLEGKSRYFSTKNVKSENYFYKKVNVEDYHEKI